MAATIASPPSGTQPLATEAWLMLRMSTAQPALASCVRVATAARMARMERALAGGCVGGGSGLKFLRVRLAAGDM